MTTKDNSGPAFQGLSFIEEGKPINMAMQMTLRDWVMGQCIAAAFGGDDEQISFEKGETIDDALKRYWTAVAKAAAIAADAMLEARK
jgi:hypothetical protein